MCLQIITKTYGKNQKTIKGWKIVYRDGNGKYRPIWFGERKYAFVKEFIRSKGKTRISTSTAVISSDIEELNYTEEDETYPEGFHVYLNKRHAHKIMKMITHPFFCTYLGFSYRLLANFMLIQVELKELICKGKERHYFPVPFNSKNGKVTDCTKVNVVVGKEIRILGEENGHT